MIENNIYWGPEVEIAARKYIEGDSTQEALIYAKTQEMALGLVRKWEGKAGSLKKYELVNDVHNKLFTAIKRFDLSKTSKIYSYLSKTGDNHIINFLNKIKNKEIKTVSYDPQDFIYVSFQMENKNNLCFADWCIQKSEQIEKQSVISESDRKKYSLCLIIDELFDEEIKKINSLTIMNKLAKNIDATVEKTREMFGSLLKEYREWCEEDAF